MAPTDGTSGRLLIAQLHGLVGRQQELEALLRALAGPSREEPGCEWFRVLREGEPGEFVVLSLWNSEQALRDHYRTPHYQRYRMQVTPLLARNSDVEVRAVGAAVHALDPNPPDPGMLG